MKNSNNPIRVVGTKLLISTAAGLAACAMLGGNAAQAQTVNFDTRGIASFGYGNYVGQGAYSDPGNNVWNVITQGSTTTGDLNSSGSSTAVTLTDTSGGSYNGGFGGNVNGAASGFFSGFLLKGGGGVSTETLNNVAAGTYNLFLYGSNTGQDRGVVFSVTGYGSQSTINANAPNGTETPTGLAFTAGVSYVEFTGITLASAGSITFSYTANQTIDRLPSAPSDQYGVNMEGDFNGLQLVAVPEPSSYALMLLGLGSVLGLRAIKRRQASV